MSQTPVQLCEKLTSALGDALLEWSNGTTVDEAHDTYFRALVTLSEARVALDQASPSPRPVDP